jgi:N utilization substance protein A
LGWTERAKEKGAEPVRHKGVLEGFELSRKDAEDIIMSARVLAGWITEEELAAAAEAAAVAQAEATAEEGEGQESSSPAELQSAGSDASATQG